jgi:hypothetical protein
VHLDRGYRAGTSPNWIKVENPRHPAVTRVMEAFEMTARVLQRTPLGRGHEFKLLAAGRAVRPPDLQGIAVPSRRTYGKTSRWPMYVKLDITRGYRAGTSPNWIKA